MEQYAQINQMYWDGSLFQWLFYASVILILIFEKRKTHKLVFGVFPIVMLVGMFNPAVTTLVGLYFRGSQQYYVRLFSVVPVFYCIAHMGTLLLCRIRGFAKMIGLCAALVLVAFVGRSLYGEPWMQRAESLQKTPSEVYQVLDAIPSEKANTKVAFPDPLYIYARQVDGNILMPYGRMLDGTKIPLLEELNKSVPDVGTAMSLARNNSVDYIVANNIPETRQAFSDSGYEPIAETTGYCVYPVTGEVTYDQVINEKRQVVSETARDPDGNPTFSEKSVISRTDFAYDRWGNCVNATYWGKDGERVSTIEGYSGIKRHHTLHGMAWLTDSYIYLDREDRPILTMGRYETRLRYIHRRDIIEESYYDREGRPMNRLDTGYARTLKQYDDEGRLVSERFSNSVGEAVECVYGYAGYDREYDTRGRITDERYYDTQGRPANNWAGFAEWTRTYGKGGAVIAQSFLDKDGRAVDMKSRVKHGSRVDLLELVREEDVADSVGVGYSWNEDGSCTVVGNAQGISWYNLIMTDRPFYFFNGQTYRVEYSSENVVLRIGFYEDSTWNRVIDGLITTDDTEFTVPRNCGAMIIRLWVAPGTSVNETVHPRIYIKADGK